MILVSGIGASTGIEYERSQCVSVPARVSGSSDVTVETISVAYEGYLILRRPSYGRWGYRKCERLSRREAA